MSVEFLQGLIDDLISGESIGLSILFFSNIVLFLLARPILNIIAPNQDTKMRAKIFQALNLLVIIFHVIDFALRSAFPVQLDGAGKVISGYEGYVIKIGLSLMVIYAGVFLYSIAGTLSRKRFGKTREIDEKTVYIETYNSRLVGLVMLVVIVLTIIYLLIKTWGADSLLGTTGIFGIFIGFLAFTSGIWAPDIVSGLIILNSDILVDGDVVVMHGHDDEFIIARVTLIYVVLYDVRNNHRTLLRNTQFIQNRIDNLSRVTSTNGIRQGLKYNIGYPAFGEDKQTRKAQLMEFRKSIEDMFEEANEICNAADNICVNPNKPFEWAMTNAGDYALEYTLWIYLERIPNTKVTSTVRRHLMGTIYKVNEAVFTASVHEGVDLSTPDMVVAQLQTPPAQTAAPQIEAKTS